MKFIVQLLIFSLFFSCTSSNLRESKAQLKKEISIEEKVDKAFRFFSENKLDKSLKIFKSLDLKTYKFYYEILNYIGVIYLRKNQPDHAKGYFNKAIQFKSNYADAYNNLGIVYLAKGRYDLALSEFQTCLHYNPRHEKALKNQKLLDDILNKKISLETIELFGKARNMKNLDDKIKAYQDILKRQINLKEAKNNLASCYYYSGDIKKAKKLFKGILEKYPRYHEAHNNYAFTLIHDGDTELAKRHYITAIRLKPTYTIVMINLGDLYFQLKDYKKAERLWRTVLKVEPQNNLAIERLELLK